MASVLFWLPGRAGRSARYALGSVGLSRTGNQVCATDQGDACGHAVGSVQSVDGRWWSADGAEGLASDHQMVGCVGRSKKFGNVFSPESWLPCRRLLNLLALGGCQTWPVCPLPRFLRGHNGQGSTGQRPLCSGRGHKADAGCLVPTALWAIAGFGQLICSRSGRRRERVGVH